MRKRRLGMSEVSPTLPPMRGAPDHRSAACRVRVAVAGDGAGSSRSSPRIPVPMMWSSSSPSDQGHAHLRGELRGVGGVAAHRHEHRVLRPPGVLQTPYSSRTRVTPTRSLRRCFACTNVVSLTRSRTTFAPPSARPRPPTPRTGPSPASTSSPPTSPRSGSTPRSWSRRSAIAFDSSPGRVATRPRSRRAHRAPGAGAPV